MQDNTKSKHKSFNFFFHSIKMLNLTLKELKSFEKNRSIKCYKRLSKNKLLSSLKASNPVRRNKTIADIRKKILILKKCLKA